MRLRTAALPSLELVFHLDGDAAEDLFRNVVPALPRRDPARHLAGWRDDPWLAAAVLAAAAGAALLAASLTRGK